MKIASISPIRTNNYNAIQKNNNKGATVIKERPANDTVSFGMFAENKVCQASPELMMQVGLLTQYGFWPFQHKVDEDDKRNYRLLRDLDYVELYCKKDSRRVNARFNYKALNKYMEEQGYSEEAADYATRVAKDYDKRFGNADVSSPGGANNICDYIRHHIETAEFRVENGYTLMPTEEREALKREEEDERDYYIATHGLF